MKLFFVFLVFSTFAYGQNKLVGDWYGKIELNSSALRIVFHLQQDLGKLIGSMDSPDQGAFGLNLNDVHVKSDSVILDLSVFGVIYNGKFISSDTIVGILKQGAQLKNLTLVKSKRPIEAKPKRTQFPLRTIEYEVKDVVFKDTKSHINLSGTLTTPKGKGPFPAVVLVSGSGPQNRDEEILNHKPFLVLADFLTRNGIMVLRYDDRGVGQSQGVFKDATTKDFAFDAQGAFAFLKKCKKVDKSRIGIIGHSEGGMIAPMVATADSKVKFIVLLAGPGIPLDQLMLKQTEISARFAGVSEDEIAISKELNRKFYAILKEEKVDSIAKMKIEKIVNDHINSMPSDIAGQIIKELPQLTSSMLSPWFRYFINFNPEFYLKQINCPVLAINGLLDCQVSAIENLQGIRTSVKETNNKNVYTYLMPDLNHLMQHCETGSVNEYLQIEETFSEEVMEIISNWIKYFEIIE